METSKIIYTMEKGQEQAIFLSPTDLFDYKLMKFASVSSCRRSSHGVLRRDAKGGPPVRQHQEQTETHQ